VKISHKVVRIGVTTAVVLAIVAVTAVIVSRTENDPTVSVVAVFKDASPLRPGNLVKVYGVEVGTVSSVRLVGGDAQVDMDVQRSLLPLHSDATAQIRPISLIGEGFVQLDVGSAAAPAINGPMVIPASRTSRAVGLDDVFNTLDDPTSAALASLVATLGEGVQGQGGNVATALAELKPVLTQVDGLSQILNEQNGALTQVVTAGQHTASALADNNGQTLDQLVGTAEQTLAAVAANRQAVDDTLTRLPATLAAARQTLAQLAGVADATTPSLAALRPLTDKLTDVSGELHQFADAANPALTTLPPVLNRLNEMLVQARPVVTALQPAGRDLHSAAGSLRPVGEALLVHNPGTPSPLEGLMTGLADWAMSTNGYDAMSHYFRAAVVVDPETLRHMVGGALPPGVVPGPSGPAAGQPQAAQPAPAQPPQNPLPPATDPGNATGLSQQQEQSLLGQLLGGGL
jgi:phospholipid/cholesterol/gamma-HCH transport system substrate-binding protein